MPSYKYRCEVGHEFTVRKPMAESGRAEFCPHCDHKAFRVFEATQRPVVYGGTPLHHGDDG